MPMVRVRSAIPASGLLLTLWQVTMTCETCPSYQRLKVLYDATCATYRAEHEAHDAWTADDDGKMVLTPAGMRALEHYGQLLRSASDTAAEPNNGR
jgi:hypothetical protein